MEGIALIHLYEFSNIILKQVSNWLVLCGMEYEVSNTHQYRAFVKTVMKALSSIKAVELAEWLNDCWHLSDSIACRKLS
jgi:hypothetical protein